MRGFRRVIIIVLGIITSFFISVFIFSYKMDPFKLWNEPTIANNNESLIRDDIYNNMLYIKARDVIRYKPNTIILGSSVGDFSVQCSGTFGRIGPQHCSKLYSSSPRDIYNACIADGDLNMAWHYLNHAYLNNPQLKKVFLELDFHLLIHKEIQEIYKKAADILGKTYVPLSFYLKYTLSKIALKYCLQIFEARCCPNPDKRYIKFIYEPWNTIFEIFSSWLTSCKFIPSQDNHFAEYQDSSLMHIDDEFLFQKINMARWFCDFPSNEKINLAPLEKVKKIVSFCKEKNIELIVYLSPLHPIAFSTIKLSKREDVFYSVIKKLANITPFYDFSQEIGFSKEVDSLFTSDILHYTSNMGELIFKFLFNHTSSPKGHLINKSNVDEFIHLHKDLLNHWISSHSRIQLIIEHFYSKPGGSLSMVPPKIYKPEYRNYRIFFFLNTYWAIPITIPPPYELTKVILLEYPGTLTAGTMEEMIITVDKNLEKFNQKM